MKRYSYSTVGYGVFSLLGEIYRMGRIEVYDNKCDSPYASFEGTYCMPFEAATKFEDWIQSLTTDHPIQIDIGSVDRCNIAVSEELKIPIDKLHDQDTVKEFYKKKYNKKND